MKGLLKSEFIKILNHRLFWIFIVVYLLGFWATSEIVQSVFKNLEKEAPLKLARFQFPMIWEYFAYISKFLNFIPLLLIFLFLANEYSYKTLRQNIINGASKGQIIISQHIMAIFLALLCLLVTVAFTLNTGLRNDDADKVYEGTSYLLNYFILTLGMFNMAIFFIHIFRGLIYSLMIFIGYFAFLENIISQLVIYYKLYEYDFISVIFNILPQHSIFGILMIEDNLRFQQVDPAIWPGLIWALIFPVASFLVLRKRDL